MITCAALSLKLAIVLLFATVTFALPLCSGGERPMSIATRLQQAIRERGFSIREFQRQMAATDADGTSYPAINRALHDRGTPSVQFLEVAADLLNVRRAWLMAGDGDMTEHPAGEDAARFGLADWFAGHVPWIELEIWLQEIERLELSERARDAFFRLALTVFDTITILRLGEITTPAGELAYRPSPALRDAMGYHVDSWTRLLTSWIEENGVSAVAAQIESHVAEIEQRFVGAVPADEVQWQFRPAVSRAAVELVRPRRRDDAPPRMTKRALLGTSHVPRDYRLPKSDAHTETAVEGSYTATTRSSASRARGSSSPSSKTTDASNTPPRPTAKSTGRRHKAK